MRPALQKPPVARRAASKQKPSSTPAAGINIRTIVESDIPSLVAIEHRIVGQGSRTAVERSIHNYIYYGDPDLRLLAEVGGRVVGFIIGEVRPWEFGHHEVGWIKVVGVDPEHQGQGVGRALGEALLKSLRSKGVAKLRTLVEQDSEDLTGYFHSLGLEGANQQVLEREI